MIETVLKGRIWVQDVIQGWPFPEAEKQDFLIKLDNTPESAQCRGSFGVRLLQHLQSQQDHDALTECMSSLQLDAWPDAFKMMPMNQMLLLCGDVMARLADARYPTLESASAHVMEPMRGAMNAVAQALMRSTMPSFTPDLYLQGLLTVFSRIIQGTLFPQLEAKAEKLDGTWSLLLEHEYNFLAEYFYPEIFWNLSGAEYGPVKAVTLDWRGPHRAILRFNF